MSNQRNDSQVALVAGGAGFLGAHLCRRLLDEGQYVICLDNFLTGSRAAVEPLLANPRFELIEHDVTDPLPENLQPTRIWNLACPASPRHYQRDPIHTWRSCVLGAMHLLELAERCGARFLQASTSEVYGDPREHPQHERYHGNVNPVGLRSCYDEGKRAAETLSADYARVRGVEVKIARIFNTYGPGMASDDGRVVSTFICQALAGEPLTVYGDGGQTRSLCYVDDMIEGLSRLMESTEGFRGPVNLGNTGEFSVLEIAERVRTLASGSTEIVFQPLPPDDPTVRQPDITLAEHHLGWRPQIPFDEGLRKTFEWFAGRQQG